MLDKLIEKRAEESRIVTEQTREAKADMGGLR